MGAGDTKEMLGLTNSMNEFGVGIYSDIVYKDMGKALRNLQQSEEIVRYIKSLSFLKRLKILFKWYY